MALGILRGRDRPDEKVEPSFEAARRFVEAFRGRFGTLECRALTGFDLTSPAQRKMMHLRGVKEKRCAALVEWAVDEIAPYLP